MESKEMNTWVYFMYRDGDNYKFISKTYVLKGTLSSVQKESLFNLYNSAQRLLVPSQISEDFLNACPLQVGVNYKSSNVRNWNEESDHSYHSLHGLEDTDRESSISMTIREFYEICMEQDFVELCP